MVRCSAVLVWPSKNYACAFEVRWSQPRRLHHNAVRGYRINCTESERHRLIVRLHRSAACRCAYGPAFVPRTARRRSSDQSVNEMPLPNAQVYLYDSPYNVDIQD